MSWYDFAQNLPWSDTQKEVRRQREERNQKWQHHVRTSRGDFYTPPQEPRSANPTYKPDRPASGNISFYDPPRRANLNRAMIVNSPQKRSKPATTTNRQEPVEVDVANQDIAPRKHVVTKYVSEFFAGPSKQPVTKVETVIVSEPGRPGEPRNNAIKETLAILKQKENELMQVIQNSGRAGTSTYEATPTLQGIVKATITVSYNPQPPEPYSSTTTIKRPMPRRPSLQRRQSFIDLPVEVPSIDIVDASFLEAARRSRRPNHRSISSFDEYDNVRRESLVDLQQLPPPSPPQQKRRIRFSDQNSFYRYPSASSVYEDVPQVASSGATVTRPTVSLPVDSGASSSSGTAVIPGFKRIVFK